MNKFAVAIVFVFSLISTLIGQEKTYFQQKVTYNINVTLNDVDHTLNGSTDIVYKNNSPDNIGFIYFHLWPNAYRNTNSAYAQQARNMGSARIFYAEKDQLGYIDSLDFTVDGKSISWELDPENQDIAILTLQKPLLPGEAININTPFKVKVPDSFSRLGHVGQSYQFTQWFPKPAVYDHKGWHPMPYLDQGEFYSEFGDYDVTITLPSNYVVGASGVLQTQSEIDFLTEVAENTSKLNFDRVDTESSVEFPESSEDFKTIRYKAENVHDFAWFADKRFHVMKDQVKLASGKTVDTWTMFTDREADLWVDAIKYVNRSVQFYSEEVGEYPWPQATAVQSALSAGAGMEYPMVTVIGISRDAHALDIVITHEVGHNWFYGILGSNERVHPWMDEGMNTFYEKRYNQKYYGKGDSLSNYLPKFLSKSFGLKNADLGYTGYLIQARRHESQAIETHSKDLTNFNYLLCGYERPAISLRYLEAYLGKEKFDNTMRLYYETWKFRHPYPEDFRKIFEEETGKDLSWFFDGVLGAKGEGTLDYAAKGVEDSKVTVVNKGSIAGPFSISTLKDGKIVSTEWHEGFEGTKTIQTPAGDHDEIRIDALEVIPEVNRKNNGQKRKLKVNLLASLENPKQKNLNITPMLGWNNYDKFMLGAAFHNTSLVAQKFEYTVAPMFATGSRDKARPNSFRTMDIVGFADFKYNHYLDEGKVKKISAGVGLKSFNYSYNTRFDYHDKYIRINPNVEFTLKGNKKKAKSGHLLRLDLPLIIERKGTVSVFEDSVYFAGNENIITPHAKLTHEYRQRGLKVESAVEYHQFKDPCTDDLEGFLKASVAANYKVAYMPKRALHFRFYGAGLLFNNQANCGGRTDHPINLISRGGTDYFYEDYYFGRNQGFRQDLPDNFLSQQINSNREGGIRAAVPGQSSVGQTDKFALSLNFKVDLPLKSINFPIKPYFDLGYYMVDDPAINSPIVFVAGLAFELGDAVGIYVPLGMSKNLKRSSFGEQIAFKLDLHKISPNNVLKSLSF